MHQTFYFFRFHQAFFVDQKVEVIQKQQMLSFFEQGLLIPWIDLFRLAHINHRFSQFIEILKLLNFLTI